MCRRDPIAGRSGRGVRRVRLRLFVPSRGGRDRRRACRWRGERPPPGACGSRRRVNVGRTHAGSRGAVRAATCRRTAVRARKKFDVDRPGRPVDVGPERPPGQSGRSGSAATSIVRAGRGRARTRPGDGRPTTSRFDGPGSTVDSSRSDSTDRRFKRIRRRVNTCHEKISHSAAAS